MAVAETTSVRVVPDPSSPAVLTILQGEVVDVVGQLNFQGQDWIKARFNAPERPRYGFIPGSEMQPLTFAAVNQSAVAQEEVPKRIRSSRSDFFGCGPAKAFPERVLHRGIPRKDGSLRG